MCCGDDARFDDETKRDENDGGVCVYYSSQADNLGEYRDWNKENKPFDDKVDLKVDTVVILFGENGIYDAKEFYDYHEWKWPEWRWDQYADFESVSKPFPE